MTAPGEQSACFIGVSAHLARLREFVNFQAKGGEPVLLIAERGLRPVEIARAIHSASERAKLPCLPIQTQSLSATDLHDLLFKPGGVLADETHATLYLNGLFELPLLVQQRLAYLVEEHRVQLYVKGRNDLRLIFATGVSPSEMSETHSPVRGLLDSLRNSTFRLAPLRERTEDLPYLVEHLAAQIIKRLGKGAHKFAPETMQTIAEYEWEGNLDELEAVLESSIEQTPPPTVAYESLPPRIREANLIRIPAEGISFFQIVEEYERTLIARALSQTNGHQVKAARLLGLRAQTLNMKLKQYSAKK
jgi:DNA-binding NtrC family response regulator